MTLYKQNKYIQNKHIQNKYIQNKLVVPVCMCSIVSDSLQPSGLPGSSVHVIFQARILEQAAISCSSGTSYPGIKPLHLLHWQVDSLPLGHLGSLLVV